MKPLVLFLLLFLATPPLYSQHNYPEDTIAIKPEILGLWTGVLVARDVTLAVTFDIEDMDGAYESRVNIPQQHIKGAPVTVTAYEGCTLTLDLASLRTTFVGTLEKQDTITGVFEQGGDVFPFELTKLNVDSLANE